MPGADLNTMPVNCETLLDSCIDNGMRGCRGLPLDHGLVQVPRWDKWMRAHRFPKQLVESINSG